MKTSLTHQPSKRSFNSTRIVLLLAILMLSLLLASAAWAATPIYVRPGGDDVNCDGTANVDYPGVGGPGLACAVKTIQKGIDLVDAAGTVQVAAGAYIENAVIGKSLTLDGAGAGTNPAVHTILDGATLGDSSGIYINAGVTNVTIQDLRVQNYVTTGDTAGVYAAGGNNNFTAQHLQVHGNTGGRGGLFMNGPVDTVLIDDVQAHNNATRGIVIWNGFKTHITLTNNDVQYNNCCGIELQDGTASGVTVTGNLVENNTDSGMAFIGLKAGAGANLIANNTVRNNGRFGMEIKLPSGTGGESDDGSIVVSGNLVEQTIPITTQRPSEERDLAGIAVYRRGWVSGNGNVDIPTGVVVKENTVNGYQQTNASSTSDGFGIVVEGTNMKVLNNIVTTSDVGIQIQQGHTPYTADTATDGDQSDLADTFFGRGNSPTASGVILNNSLAGNSVGMRNVGVPAASATLTCNWWNDLSGPAHASNPGGLGQALTGDGAFSPWLIDTAAADASGDPGLQLPTSFSVAAGADTSAADNNYRSLANAVGCVKSGQTVNLSGTFNFGATNAQASWALGTDAITSTSDDYEVDAPANANNVTLTAASLGAATIQGPGDLPSIDLEGFLQFYNNGTNQNWTISNLQVLDFDLGIGMFCCGGSPANAYDGTMITGNLIRLAEDLKGATASGPENFQNIGIHLAYGKNQTVSNNTIEIPGDGASDPTTAGADWWTYGATPGWLYSSHVALQSNTHGGDAYDGLLITGNTLKVLDAQFANPSRIIGIWENGHSHDSDITVSNNDFQNLDAGNDPDLNRQMAFRVTSHSGAGTTVTYSGNTMQGVGMGFGSLDVSSGLQPVQVTDNTVTNVKTGMLMKGNNQWHLTGNSLSNSGDMAGLGTGVDVGATAAATMDTTENVVSGFAAGVVVDGSLTASDNHFDSNQTGVLVQGSGAATLSNNSIANNSVIGVNNTTAVVVMAENNWWGSTDGPSDPAGTLEMPENPAATVPQMKNTIPAGSLGNAVSDLVDYYPWDATPPLPYIVVHKQTFPDGDPTSFQFRLRGPVSRNFSLTDNQPHSTGVIPAGIYTLEEVLPPGWDPAVPLSSLTCDDGSPLNAIDLAADEALVCRFLNYKRGNIVVKKVTIPAVAAPSFSMRLINNTTLAKTFFSLANAQQFDTGAISSAPTYKLLETVPGGWRKKNIVCSNGSPSTAIAIPPGGTVTCTVTNENTIPSNILLSNSSVAENKVAGTLVGNLSASDAAAGDTHTFSFVNDGTPAAANNGNFQIVGNQLKTGKKFDFEQKSSHNIKLMVTDSVGQVKVKAFVISIINGPN